MVAVDVRARWLRLPWVVALAPILIFFDALIGRRLLAPGDGYGQYIPWYVVAAQSWRSGDLPTWNPFAYSGSPHLATAQPGVFYPPNLLFLILDPVIAANAVIVINFVIAGVGAWLLTRHLCKDEAAAATAGLAFGLSGFMFARIGHQGMIATAAWLPWILFGLELLRERFSAARAIFASATFALSVFAGHSQILFVNLLAVVVYMGVLLLIETKRTRTLFAGAIVLAAGVALGAMQLLPTMELVSETTRTRYSYEEAMTYSFPTSHAALLVFPYLFGNAYGVEPYSRSYVGEWNLTEMTGYPGVAALALAAAGLGSARRDRRVVALLAAGLLTALLAFGPATPLSKLFYQLPAYGQFRSWARFIVVLDLIIAVLAGYGVARLRQGRPHGRGALLAALVAASAVVVAAFLLPVQEGVRRFIPVGGPELVTLAIPAIAGLLGATAAALLWLRRRIATPFVLLVVGLDLVFSFGGFYEWRFASPTVADFRHDLSRLPHSWGNVTGTPGGIDRYMVVGGDVGPLGREFLHPTDMRGDRSTNGNNPLAPREYLEAVGMTTWGAVYSTEDVWRQGSRLLDLLRVSTVIMNPESAGGGPGPGSLLGEGRPVYGGGVDVGEGVMVRYEYTPQLPEAFLVGSVVTQSRSEVLDRLWGRTPFDPLTTAFIEQSCIECPAGPTVGAGQVQVIRWGFNSVSLEVRAERPSMLVVSQAWFPGWHAWVDGDEAPVLRVDGIVQGIPVEAGAHRVLLEYRAPGLRLGFFISMFTVTLLAAWMVAERARVRFGRSAGG
jgi:hypothetical protein